MQGELVGLSLATAPGKACYIPLGHRTAATISSAAGRRRARSRPAKRSTRLKPLLEDRSVLKIAHDLKFDCLCFRRHGIEIAPIDDTMLLSYALDAGTGGNGMAELAERWLGHKPIAFKDVAGTRQGCGDLRPRAGRQGDRIRRARMPTSRCGCGWC